MENRVDLASSLPEFYQQLVTDRVTKGRTLLPRPSEKSKGDMVRSTAILSTCRNYRYLLGREWNASFPTLLYIGLNPSTADAFHDDPTIRRCTGFAKSLNFGSYFVINLFALRSKDPNKLKEASDPIGEWNDLVLTSLSDLQIPTIFMWGSKGGFRNRDEVAEEKFKNAFCFGYNQDNTPKHPLYLASQTKLVRFHTGESLVGRIEFERSVRSSSYESTLSMLEQRAPHLKSLENGCLPLFVS